MKEFFRIWRLLSTRGKKDLLFLHFGFAVTALLEVLALVAVTPFVSYVTGNEIPIPLKKMMAVFHIGQSSSSLVFICIFMVSLFVIKNLATLILVWFQTSVIHREQSVSTLKVFKDYLSGGMDLYQDTKDSDMYRLLQRDIPLTYECVLLPLSFLLFEAKVVVALIALLVLSDPLSTLGAIALMLSSVLIYNHSLKERVKTWGQRNFESLQKLADTYLESIRAFCEIKVFGQEPFIQNRLKGLLKTNGISWKWFRTLNDLPRLYLETVAVISVTILSLIMLLNPEKRESIAVFLGLFTLATFRLLPSLSRITTSIHSISYHWPSFERLEQTVFGTNKTNFHETATTEPLNSFNLVQLNSVSFAYPHGHRNVIQDFSLTISRGDCVAIVGPSGAGKSTFVKLILGLLQPTNGNIRVNELSMETITKSWREIIGYVPQDPILLNASIEENIGFATPGQKINSKRLHESLKQAHMLKFVESLPEKEKSLLGAGGLGLSGGQVQRIAIARALYRNPELLILDEFTSSLDEQTESQILKEIEEMKGKRTIILISHRTKVISICDKTVQLEALPEENLSIQNR